MEILDFLSNEILVKIYKNFLANNNLADDSDAITISDIEDYIKQELTIHDIEPFLYSVVEIKTSDILVFLTDDEVRSAGTEYSLPDYESYYNTVVADSENRQIRIISNINHSKVSRVNNTYSYKLPTAGVYGSFDFGEVQAATLRAAKLKAKSVMKREIERINTLIAPASIGVNFDDIEVTLVEP